MASACNGLELGLGSQPETGLGPSTQTLATRPVVSDKGPGPLALQKRISTKMEISEASKVFIRRKKSIQYVWIDIQSDSGRELLSSILMVV